MCSFKQFSECVGGQPHNWEKLEPIGRTGSCMEDRWDPRDFYSCKNCDSQVMIDSALPERSSLGPPVSLPGDQVPPTDLSVTC
jgi:hypothetical protein